MITISILGLDQYVVGHYSGENTAKLARLFETKPENINFYAPESFLFHDGIEQTSWNTLVRVHAPVRCRKVQDLVAKYLLATLEGITIHVAVEFYYYQETDRYEKVNKDYPRFITEANMVTAEDDEEEEEENPELYEGNIFKEFESQLQGKESKDVAHDAHEQDASCTCDHDHEKGHEEGGACSCEHDAKPKSHR